uniref:Saposin B-type domain-containing protein n=1 Tax=Panagrolaimus sp. PS1159 TaxID=55785 RepID=A0AC35GG04_9BILA
MVKQITVLAFFAIFVIVSAHIVAYKPSAFAEKRLQDSCRTCEYIIRRAENHFANGSFTTNELLRQLERECIKLANTDGDEAAVACINMVQNNNIAVIYNDVQAHIPAKQVCQDINQCPHTSGATTSWNVTTINPTQSWNVSTTALPGNSTGQTQGFNYTTTSFPGNMSTTGQQWNISTTAFPWNVTTSSQGWNFTTTGSFGNMTTSGHQWNVTALPTTGAPTWNSTVPTGNNTVANLLERLQSAKNVFVFTLN